jgi:hypothetical protein
MKITASPKTAAIAGIWSALGLVPLDPWLEAHRSISVLSHNVVFLVVTAVFFFLPGYFLVIGHGNQPFSQTWFLDSQQRAHYAIIVRRMFVWFVSAGVTGMLWSQILGLLAERPGGA